MKLDGDNIYNESLYWLNDGKRLLDNLASDFETREMPKDFGTPSSYNRISNELNAMQHIIGQAYDLLCIAYDGVADSEYTNGMIKLMAQSITEHESAQEVNA